MLSPLRLCTLCVVAAWLVGATVDAEGAGDEAGLALASAFEGVGGPGAYTKQSEHEVPDFMEVSRKLVTGSWKACKDSCDSDASCGGFKFSKAVGDHTPLCEILGDSSFSGSSLGSPQQDEAPQDTDVADKIEKRLTTDFQEKKRLKAAAHTAQMAMKKMASQVLKGQKKIQELAESEDARSSTIIRQKAQFKKEHAKVRALEKQLQQAKHQAHVSEERLRERNDERSLENHLHHVRVENSVRLKEAKEEVREDEARADDANAAVTKAEDKLQQEKEGGADQKSIQEDKTAVTDAKQEAVEANDAESQAKQTEADDVKEGTKEERESMDEIKQREDDNVAEKKEDVSSAEEQLDMDTKADKPQSDVDADKAKVDSSKATEMNAEIEQAEVDSDLKKAEREDKSVDKEVESEEERAEEAAQADVKAVKEVAKNKAEELEEKLADEEKVVDQQKDELATTHHEMALMKKLDAKKIETANLMRKIAEAKLKASGKDGVMAKKLDDEIEIGKENLVRTQHAGAEFGMMEKKQKSVVKMSTKSTKMILNNLNGTVLVNADVYKRLEARSKVLDAQQKEKKNDVESSNSTANNINIAVANMKVVELENEIAFLKKKMAKMVAQFGEAIKKQEEAKKKLREKNAKAVEKARLQAEAHLAERKSTLLKLHETLSERRKKLEVDINAIKSRGKLEGEKKVKLIDDYTSLLKEEEHLKDQLVIVRNVAGKQMALRSAYESRSQAVMASKGSVFIKNSQMQAAVARYASDLMALQKYLVLMRNIAGAKSATSVMDTMQEMKKQKSDVVMDIAKQSSKQAHDLIDKQLASNVQDIDSADSAKVPAMLAAMQKKKLELQAELANAKQNKPSLNDVVRGEYKAVSESSNPAAVNRLLARLDSQLKSVQNSTVNAKITSDLDMGRSVSRIYAHQIAHAKDHAYLEHKVGMLAKWRARLAAEVQKLKNSGNAPDLQPNEEEHYNKMLTEVTKEEPVSPTPAPPVQQKSTTNSSSLDESVKAHLASTAVDSKLLDTDPVKEAMKKNDVDGAVKSYFDIKAARQEAKLTGKAAPEASMVLGDAAAFNMEGPSDLVDLSSL